LDEEARSNAEELLLGFGVPDPQVFRVEDWEPAGRVVVFTQAGVQRREHRLALVCGDEVSFCDGWDVRGQFSS
jgi:hypothetical protein